MDPYMRGTSTNNSCFFFVVFFVMELKCFMANLSFRFFGGKLPESDKVKNVFASVVLGKCLYLFPQAEVESAHIWTPHWGPDCAFLRQS